MCEVGGWGTKVGVVLNESICVCYIAEFAVELGNSQTWKLNIESRGFKVILVKLKILLSRKEDLNPNIFREIALFDI